MMLSLRLRLAVIIALGAMVIVIIAANWGFWPFRRGIEVTDNAYVRGDVTTIAPKVAGYVSEVLVGDYQYVRVGQPLFRLEREDYAALVARADAQLAASEAALANNRSRQQIQLASIEQAKARLKSTQALALRAQLDNERALALVDSGAVSISTRDFAKADLSSTGASALEAAAALEMAKRQMGSLAAEEGQLAAQIEVAQADQKTAALNLGYTTIRSPVDGVTSERQAHLGQYVRAGTLLLSIVPHQRFWVVANFKERQLAHIAIGNAVLIRIDALGGRELHGQVESFAPASGAEFALVPPDNATGNFTKIARRFGVRIALDAGDEVGLARLRPGMSVEVSVRELDSRRDGPAPFATTAEGRPLEPAPAGKPMTRVQTQSGG
jgi:membrane fusion protein, multidrug efflux system